MRRLILRRALSTDKRESAQLQTIQETRSVKLIVRIITSATATPLSATSNLPRGGEGIRLAITSIARGPRVMIVRRIAMSSSVGVIARQPGIRMTLHAGEVLPQP